MNFMEAIDLVEKGLKTWAEKEHNRKWWRRIDGTPIPNDLCVVIAETIVAAFPVAPPADSGESEDEMIRRILAASPEEVMAECERLRKALELFAGVLIGGAIADDPVNREKYPLLTQHIINARSALHPEGAKDGQS